jgi:NAD(P)-dependent dehydrogenase (short-subunit alcohol dehydrogenase family)
MVTGASRGIGRAIARRFARDGDDVLGVGRDVAALEALARETAHISVARCDVTDEDDVKALFATHDDIEVLVCNAGAAAAAPLERTTLDTWRSLLDVNATSVFLSLREAIPGMRRLGRGRIVVIASTAGRAGTPYTAAYAASKHAAVGLVRVAASELAGTEITANAICPTFVDTPMTDRSVANIAERTGRGEEESRAMLASQAPLGRLLQPEEVAATAHWLASADAVSINGQTVVLDGGGIQA